jgi:hypothetical protein
MHNPDHISRRSETVFWVKILLFFDADPGSGITSRIRNTGYMNLMQNTGSGVGLLLLGGGDER